MSSEESFDPDQFEEQLGDPTAETEGPSDPPPEESVVAPSLLVSLCTAAEQHYGLHVGECDAPGAPARWGPVHRVHAPGSFHYLHRAADISGLELNMGRFTAWVSDTYGPRITELIHNPGGSIKNGKHVPASFWGSAWEKHRNHVHLAI
jgi:hypothetical protein